MRRVSIVARRAVSVLACGVTVVAVAACSQLTGSGNRVGTSPVSATRAPSTVPSVARALSGAVVPIAVLSHGQSQVELVPIYVDGHGPYAFLLDTGSSISSVSPQLAAGLRLPRSGKTAQISGVATIAKAPLVSITDWRLGRYRLPAPAASARRAIAA